MAAWSVAVNEFPGGLCEGHECFPGCWVKHLCSCGAESWHSCSGSERVLVRRFLFFQEGTVTRCRNRVQSLSLQERQAPVAGPHRGQLLFVAVRELQVTVVCHICFGCLEVVKAQQHGAVGRHQGEPQLAALRGQS